MISAQKLPAPWVATLAMAFPFWFAWTQPPMSSFWPLVATALCACVLLLHWVLRAPRAMAVADWRAATGRVLAAALLLAAVVSAGIGLVQFFMGDPGWAPWIYPSFPGQALGNLRQRNQQATLLALGAWALLWWVARLQAQTEAPPAQGRRPWGLMALAALIPWALVLLAVGSGATASRTGAMEWVVLLLLALYWRRQFGGLALGVGALGCGVFVLASWALPDLLKRWTGFSLEGLFDRVAEETHRCTSRQNLWSNVLELIAQKPWTGWGWGELDYAHYSTLFRGERFCVLLDNAHNLPLHLAVELGVPVAVLLCGGALWAAVRAKPWRETDAVRQLAWGVLVLVGLHSMLEFPLWYGPFQLVTVVAVAVLCLPRPGVRQALNTGAWSVVRVTAGLAVLVLLFGSAWVGRDYVRMSQIYQPMEERLKAYQTIRPADALRNAGLFRAPAEFAVLTTTPITRDNAEDMYDMARRLLHYSPEPRVITQLIESAELLGHEAEAQAQWLRLKIAYPDAFEAYSRKRAGSAGDAEPVLSRSAREVQR